MASKIVVLGDVNGRFTEVFARLASLHAKQGFAFAIIAGKLFGEDDSNELDKLLSAELPVPLPIYTIPGHHHIPEKARAFYETGELCPNLSVITKTLKTSDGFRIATTQSSIGGDADILVTDDWPAGVQDGASAQYVGSTPPPQGVRSVSDLCTALKPRYHFATSEAYYEREPFFHNGPAPHSVTRFISLAPFGNAFKHKWIYAFNLEPSAPPPTAIPPGCTASPLTAPKKRKAEAHDTNVNNFRFANGNGNAHHDSEYGSRKRGKWQPPPKPDQCYFCLSNPACETHMIGSIGNDVYLTIAKGPLTTRTTFPELGFPGHMLLIPLQHAPTTSAIPDDETRRATMNEMQRYRGALQNMLVECSKGEDGQSKLGAVTWEISRGSGVHLHWQFLPMPADMIQRGLVEAGFDVEAENLSYPKFAKSFKEMEKVEEGNDFFKVMIWSETLRKEMVMPLDKSFRFDLQFGRRVLGKLLGLEQRTHWRKCEQTKVEEEADAETFKTAFKAFDFSLED
ncbi:hypothetical protein BAUCODRAFT_109532 [Baudoinia panamericana UAMH 10762]|uniref:Cwf19-like C-terminal domain-containing protein n=1 Tax=Baudoinia panamericana (strain UAMH 10762) TaxID=717646 RepID=M2NAJ2_BAUPA|nr:uncharacterized protein BAUCODRAFT_109532 [Baudoinia panamericana UAMH 10762]EMC95870.1 hypothetical protein BAUCODRAFT_109532 [Baudoinia panamericana UAMH 10762]